MVGRPKKRPSPDGEWRCTKCLRYKAPDKFYKNSYSANGLMSQCKQCVINYHTRNSHHTRAEPLRDHYLEILGDVREEIMETLLALELDKEIAESDPSHIPTWRQAQEDINRIVASVRRAQHQARLDKIDRLVQEDLEEAPEAVTPAPPPAEQTPAIPRADHFSVGGYEVQRLGPPSAGPGALGETQRTRTSSSTDEVDEDYERYLKLIKEGN
jgi:hypothetical protein